MSHIYKISPRDAWLKAQAQGTFVGAPIDLQDGYIHFSTATQVRETAARHFVGQANLILAVIRTDDLGDALRWEPSRGGELFPHLYAPLAMQAVAEVFDLPLLQDGSHDFPEHVQ
jgi:uncharacterized protein (DUF952 family)